MNVDLWQIIVIIVGGAWAITGYFMKRSWDRLEQGFQAVSNSLGDLRVLIAGDLVTRDEHDASIKDVHGRIDGILGPDGPIHRMAGKMHTLVTDVEVMKRGGK